MWFTSLTSTSFAQNTFTYRLPGEPETLDWNLAHTMIETYVLMNLMEGLVTYDEGFKIQPSLAERWTVSADRKTYTFTLRSGVVWSDGVPMKADDFVFSWTRLLSPTTAASYAYLLFDIQGAEEFNRGTLQDPTQLGIRAIDDRTLEVRLKSPIAHWLHIPTFWVTFPLRRDVVQKHGNAWSRPGNMVTLGPFNLESREIDNRITLAANPRYYRPRGNIDRAVAMIVKDNSTALELYESGKLDFVNDLATLDLKRLEKRPDLKRFPYLKTGYLGFVVSGFPVNLVRVRRAIAMGLDRSVFEKVLTGGQKAASTLVPPGLLAHRSPFGLPFNPTRAKAELRRSGWDPGRPVKIELLTPNWDKQLLMAQVIQELLKKNLGVSVTLQPFDHRTFRANLDLHSYPLFEASWGADFPDPDNFLSIFLSNSGNNRTLWKNSHYDELVLQARVLSDSREREKRYLEAQKILIEDEAVIIPLYYEPNLALIKPRVSGAKLNPLNYLILRDVRVQ